MVNFGASMIRLEFKKKIFHLSTVLEHPHLLRVNHGAFELIISCLIKFNRRITSQEMGGYMVGGYAIDFMTFMANNATY